MTRDEDCVELCLQDGLLDVSDEGNVFVSRLGGRPAWLTEELPASALRCGRCSAQLFLLLQLDAPLAQHPSLDRVLYVFACNTRACTEAPDRNTNGSVVAIVQQRLSAQRAPAVSAETVPKPSFYDDLMATPVDAAVGRMRIDESSEDEAGVLSTYTYPVALPGLRLRIVDELISARPQPRPDAQGHVAVGEADASEAYERMDLPGVDRVIKAFTKRVAHYPHQVARYAPDGQPLHFSADAFDEAPHCTSCGAQPRFDAQVMPAALVKLPVGAFVGHVRKEDRSTHPLCGDAMEWGTIMVYTCQSLSCTRTLVRVQVEDVSFP